MFEKIAIGIKTFLRDEKLFEAVAGIRENLPGARMLIADCGEATLEKSRLYRDLVYENHRVIHLPFDAGFGAMSNAIVELLSREYLLIGSDDFNFRPREVRNGIEKMIQVLDSLPTVSIASGRVNNRPYEYDLVDHRKSIYEVPCDFDDCLIKVPAVLCDLTVNYGLIRREVFEKVRWDEDVKIGGGEHGAFFVDVKRAGFKVAYVPGVNINQQPSRDSERYRQYRLRANNPARPCFDKRGIRKYILGNGQVDYERKD